MRPGGQTGETIGQFLARLLDRRYTQTAGRVVAAVSAAANRPALTTALDALVADYAARGPAALSARSRTYRALLAELNTMTAQQAAVMRSGAPYVMAAMREAAAESVPTLALWGSNAALRTQLGAVWNTPDPEAVQALVERARRPAFDAAMTRFGEGTADAVRAIVTRGLVEGTNARALGRALTQAIADVPRYQANTLMRTLQLTAYRDATAIHQAANANLIARVVRIAALDDRTCLSCLALHGTEVPVGERVDDHYSGRCIGISVVRGREVNVQTGEDWLRGLPEERQRTIMGPAKFEAWKAGAVRLQEFVARRDDPVFGQMVQEASLKGLLGAAGSRTYIEIGREARR